MIVFLISFSDIFVISVWIYNIFVCNDFVSCDVNEFDY